MIPTQMRLLTTISLGWLALLLLGFVLQHNANAVQEPRLSAQTMSGQPTKSRSVQPPNANQTNPFLNVFPDPDGRTLYVSIYGLGAPVSDLFVNAKIGPTGHQYSYTASYSNTLGAYAATVVGFTPGQDALVSLNITSTAGINTPAQSYPRFFMPAGLARSVQVGNGTLALSAINTDTFANDTYLAFAPGFAPASVVPTGYRVLNQPYTINASGSITGTTRPLLLTFRYNATELQGAAPDALAIMQWQPATQQWLRLPSRVFSARGEVVATIRRFTTYALMVTPTWRDDFDDLSGLELSALHQVDLNLKEGVVEVLTLTANAVNGVAVSQPITPPVSIRQWDRLLYSAVAMPPTTTLTIDLLDSQGRLLLADVPSGASLAEFDPTQYPVLRLRAIFSATIPGQSAALDEWQLSWQTVQPPSYYLYLPEIRR